MLLSGGVGLTPLLSMLDAVAGQPPAAPVPVRPWHAERRDARHGRRGPGAGGRGGRIAVTTFYESPRREDLAGADYDDAGRITLDWLRANTPMAEADYYLCGPRDFLRSFVGGLAGPGFRARGSTTSSSARRTSCSPPEGRSRRRAKGAARRRARPCAAHPGGGLRVTGRSAAGRRPSRAATRSASQNITGFTAMVISATASTRSRPSSGSTFSVTPSPARMKQNSPICAQRRGDGQRLPAGSPRARAIAQAAADLPTTTTAPPPPAPAARAAGRRVEQHADRDEEQHREGVAQRQRLLGRLLAERRLRPAPGRRGRRPARTTRRTATTRPVGDAERRHQRGEREQLARPLRADHATAASGITRLPTTSISTTKAATLPSVTSSETSIRLPGDAHAGQHARRRAAIQQRRANGGSSTSASTIARSSTTSQPTAILPVHGLQHAAFLQRAQQHHGAGDRQRQSRTPGPARRSSPNSRASAPAEQRGDRHLHQRAGHGDAAHRQQVARREMQADAEHQQDHADLGQLAGQCQVGDEARRVRPDQHAGEQVADQRRQPQLARDHPQQQCRGQGGNQRGDQRGVVRHPLYVRDTARQCTPCVKASDNAPQVLGEIGRVQRLAGGDAAAGPGSRAGRPGRAPSPAASPSAAACRPSASASSSPGTSRRAAAHQLRRGHGAQRVAGEIAEGAVMPVDVLQAALRVVGRGDAEQAAAAPRSRRRAGRPPPDRRRSARVPAGSAG